MHTTFQALAAFLTARFDIKSERGATAVEYGIMVAAIAVVIIGTVFAIGPQLNAMFVQVQEALPAVAG